MTKVVEIREAEGGLRKLLALVASGDEVVLVENDRPIARLAPVSQSASRRIPNLHPGALVPSDDFDDPLPDEFWFGNADETAS